MFGTVNAFQHKLPLFLIQIEKLNFSHFKCCAIVKKRLVHQFYKQTYMQILNFFKNIRVNEKLINLFENPFNMDPENIETSLQY